MKAVILALLLLSKTPPQTGPCSYGKCCLQQSNALTAKGWRFALDKGAGIEYNDS
jgi:hypothetical protein